MQKWLGFTGLGGFRVWGLGFRVQGLGFRDSRFRGVSTGI